VTTETKSGPWTIEGGYGTITIDLSPDGMIWDSDRRRPTLDGSRNATIPRSFKP
jgi:hypothetical protein